MTTTSPLSDPHARPLRTRIKFCGLRRAEDVALAVALGVDAVGFVCVPESPRCVDLDVAGAIRATLPPFVSCVALLRNPAPAQVEAVLRRLRPDLLQFHGEEPAAFCRQFDRRYIKAVALGGDGALPPTHEYADAAALLLDGHPPGELGGQGRAFDWGRVVGDTTVPLMLAGGLTPHNVGIAIRRLRPYAVDVSSGIEADPRAAPAVKDSGKMAAFVDAVRAADSA